MTEALLEEVRVHRRIAYACTFAALAIAPINAVVFFTALNGSDGAGFVAFVLLGLLQALLGAIAFGVGVALAVRLRRRGLPVSGGVVSTLFGGLAGLGGVTGLGLAALALGAMAGGGAWGRPLRIRGRVRHPELCESGAWARGGATVRGALEEASRALADEPRPTAVSAEKLPLVEKACPRALLAHGRLPDATWAELHAARLHATTERLHTMLADAQRADAEPALRAA